MDKTSKPKKGSIASLFAKLEKRNERTETNPTDPTEAVGQSNLHVVTSGYTLPLNLQTENMSSKSKPEFDNELLTEDEGIDLQHVESNNESLVNTPENMNVKITYPTVQQYLHSWKENGRNFVYCIACFANPEIIKRYRGSNYHKPPPITTKTGTRFRSETVKEHFNTQFHNESVKAMRLKTVHMIPAEPQVLDVMISKANEKRANFIGNLAVSVFNDAKRLTLTAWNWPSRVISYQLGKIFDFNKQTSKNELDKINLHYVTPKSHAEILECIVDSNKPSIADKVNTCLALSLRCDGSVDRTNIDKIYVLAKTINRKGHPETIFIGVGEKTKRKVDGLLDAVKEAINAQHPDLYKPIMKKMSSFVTDGAPENIGSPETVLSNTSSVITNTSSKNDNSSNLWKLIDMETKKCGSDINVMKIWCAAHRSELCWKCISKEIKEVQEMFSRLSELSSHFHGSAMRYAQLKEIARSKDLQLLTFPKVFEVRWSQFTYSLVHSVLTSWNCIVLYLKETKENAVILKFLTNFKKLQIMTFVADVLFIFQRFQKKIQADDLNVISLHKSIKNLCYAITKLGCEPLTGGWESTLRNSIAEYYDEDGQRQVTLNNIELSVEELERRGAHNKKRDYEFVKAEILRELLAYLKYYMKTDDDFIKVIEPFINLDNEKINMNELHRLVAPDLDISSLSLQFQELCESESALRKLSLEELVLHLANNDTTSSYVDVLKALSRIAAATPHSADVERTISANNLLKMSIRNNLNLETENNYLHVHFNMSTLTEYDPRETVMNWIKKKDRRQTNTTFANIEKNQEHFIGVFPEAKKRKRGARQEDFEQDIEADGSENTKKKRKF